MCVKQLEHSQVENSHWDKLPHELQEYIIKIKKENKQRDYEQECHRLYEKNIERFDKCGYYINTDFVYTIRLTFEDEETHHTHSYNIGCIVASKYEGGKYVGIETQCIVVQKERSYMKYPEYTFYPLNRQGVKETKKLVNELCNTPDAIIEQADTDIPYNTKADPKNKFVKKLSNFFTRQVFHDDYI